MPRRDFKGATERYQDEEIKEQKSAISNKTERLEGRSERLEKDNLVALVCFTKNHGNHVQTNNAGKSNNIL